MIALDWPLYGASHLTLYSFALHPHWRWQVTHVATHLPSGRLTWKPMSGKRPLRPPPNILTFTLTSLTFGTGIMGETSYNKKKPMD